MASILAVHVKVAQAQPGSHLGTVVMPGNGACSVALAYDGTYAMTTRTDGCSSSLIGIYRPPVGGNGVADLIAIKNVETAEGVPVVVSAIDWDPTRNKLWAVQGSFAGQTWLIDLGDKTASGPATATLAWSYSIDGIELIDGLAWDREADRLLISPDIDESVYFFDASTGAFQKAVQPKNAAGVPDADVSGVAIGSQRTLYIARNGTGEIRRVDKETGDFVSGFATINHRIEDAVCADPRLYGVEALLVKDAYGGSFDAFEVEPGTCPLVTEDVRGTFTGGGSITSLVFGKVTHGFELNCDKREGPNSLEVNWNGNKFHLEVLEEAKCVDTSGIEPEQPGAKFDTYIGKGSGRCNGGAATATWNFKDAGEPGKGMDTAEITITGSCSLVVAGTLEPGGNHQAHDPHPTQKQ
ncbi:MAG TPA: hypothetical protein VJ691_06145 [Vicinamibacterales bacterium]|nr:hypothetical protein [Vicinamibacterales bacterium]